MVDGPLDLGRSGPPDGGDRPAQQSAGTKRAGLRALRHRPRSRSLRRSGAAARATRTRQEHLTLQPEQHPADEPVTRISHPCPAATQPARALATYADRVQQREQPAPDKSTSPCSPSNARLMNPLTRIKPPTPGGDPTGPRSRFLRQSGAAARATRTRREQLTLQPEQRPADEQAAMPRYRRPTRDAL